MTVAAPAEAKSNDQQLDPGGAKPNVVAMFAAVTPTQVLYCW
jgi:hypothetical protein